MNNQSTKPEQIPDDLGLGTKVFSLQRFINKDGSFNVRRSGGKSWTPYQSLLEESWQRLLLEIVSYFVLINLFFAVILVGIGVDSISGLTRKSFVIDLANAFFFSMQTFTTVGYGSMSPQSWSAHILSAIIAFVGLLAFALATGIVYGRFSKPKARILFSQKAVICKYKDTTALMFRIVNKRNHKIIDVECGLFCTWIENNNGLPKRNFSKLELERQIIFLFPMNWTIVHPIREGSPFYGQSQASLMAINLELIIQIKGYDESYNQTIHVNSSYLAEEMVWGEKFAPMVTSDETGTVVHLNLVDERMADV